MGTVIKVENLSKQYRLGDVGTGSLKDDFKRLRHRLMGKEDPFLKVGEENDRTRKSNSDYVWALKDVNFEIEQGDVVGIIGRNGAGKSTLLKILSRTTAPTTGSVKIKGRIASLLEVGTGFHGELSGRENIYLNGAIMGLRKWEIEKKLDEIIDFAGVEKYLDTPVKRYSSGMYVRLAFAVAAHLDPDILIVDEVLAVGDAEFQNKCIVKMKDVSMNNGRTILVVSHNMQVLQKLCLSSILMNNGAIKAFAKIDKIINQYLQNETSNILKYYADENDPNSGSIENGFVESIIICDLAGNELDFLKVGAYFQIRIKFKIFKTLTNFVVGIGLSTSIDFPIHTAWSKPSKIDSGYFEAVFIYNHILLSSGQYKLSVGLSNHGKSFLFLEKAIIFDISEIKHDDIKDNESILKTSDVGLILNPVNIQIHKIV
jgi:lipopolysaccharide transport system ATP-binding protein